VVHTDAIVSSLSTLRTMSFTSGAFVVSESERIGCAGVIPSSFAESRAGFHTAVMSARVRVRAGFQPNVGR
jgi:hypothetical protein